MADENNTHLFIWGKDGTHVAYALTEKPKIILNENDLLVITKGIEVTYPLNNLSRFTFDDNEEEKVSTSINNLMTEKRQAKIEGDNLIFPHLSSNSTVTIVSLNGSLIFKKTIRTTGDYIYSISNMKSGIYIVSINNLTYKVSVK